MSAIWDEMMRDPDFQHWIEAMQEYHSRVRYWLVAQFGARYETHVLTKTGAVVIFDDLTHQEVTLPKRITDTIPRSNNDGLDWQAE